MSTIKTGTTLTTAYQVEGDTTGALVIQTGATPTTAATFDTSQNTTVAGNLTLSGTGKRITGDFSNATVGSRVAFQTSTANSATRVDVIPSGTGTVGEFGMFNNSDTTLAGYAAIRMRSGDMQITSEINGAVSYLPMTFYTGGSERMRIDTSGVVLVGASTQVRSSSNPSVQIASAGGEQLVIRHTSATAGRLWRFASDSNNTVYIINQDTTGVYIGNGGSSWLSLSDERHKDIIEPITNAAEKVSTLRAVIGKYKKDEDGKRRSFLIAQDVQAVLPEAVFSADPEQLGLSYTDTIPLLVAAIQELKAELDAAKADIATLKGAAQ